MQRARRLVLLPALALAGSLALTGCRSQPGTAIYVGSTTYSEKYVDGLSDQLQKVSNLGAGDRRKSIAQWIVVRDLGKRIVANNGWPAPQVDEQGATAQVRDILSTSQADPQRTLDSVRPMINLLAEYEAYRGTVEQHATAVQATDADYADLLQRLKAAGAVDPNTDVATYRQNLGAQNDQLFRTNVGASRMYSEAVKKADITINPKYAPVELGLLYDQQNHPLVLVPLTANADQTAVVPAPPQPLGPANS